MTKAFILILLMSGSSKGGLTTAEFATMDACEAAAAIVTDGAPALVHIYAYCVDNGGAE